MCLQHCKKITAKIKNNKAKKKFQPQEHSKFHPLPHSLSTKIPKSLTKPTKSKTMRLHKPRKKFHKPRSPPPKHPQVTATQTPSQLPNHQDP